MKKEKIINGCEFQDGCIEYKDISYLKVMPICAIYELSIACHDKENKCKYYQVYKQLKRAKEKLERIENTCKNIKQVDNKVSIRLIEEILEDKFDIHYFLEKEEIELEGNNEKIELGD